MGENAMHYHELLTNEGAYTHERTRQGYFDESSSSPSPCGGPTYDIYYGDSHMLEFEDGILTDIVPMDWDDYRYWMRRSNGIKG
jgi:hypothetical protein